MGKLYVTIPNYDANLGTSYYFIFIRSGLFNFNSRLKTISSFSMKLPEVCKKIRELFKYFILSFFQDTVQFTFDFLIKRQRLV